MISALLGFLVTSAGSAVTPATVLTAASTDDPPVRISLSSSGYYYQGDRAKVRVRVADDGYLLVLRADADGRVRVLYPLDPGDDDFVRGGKEFELRGRGDRESFYVDDVRGNGTVLAARSSSPFRFDQFVRGDHWDYRVLTSDRIHDDPEAGLLDIVDQMADSTHYDYDVVNYTVGGGTARPYYSGYDGGYGPGYFGPGLHIGLAFGSPYYRRYCDPFFYGPFYCDDFYYDPFYSYRPYGFYRPFGFSYYRPRPFVYRQVPQFTGFAFKRPSSPPPLVLPRQRFPGTGTPVRWTGPSGVQGGRDQPPVDVRRRAVTPPPARDDHDRAPPPSTNSRPSSRRDGSASSGSGNGRSGGSSSAGGGGGGRGSSAPSAGRSSGSRPSNGGGGGGRRRP